MIRSGILSLAAIVLFWGGAAKAHEMDFDRYFQLMNAQTAAIEAENWNDAVRVARQLAGNHCGFYVALDDATERLVLAMLEWNVGNVAAALGQMDRVVSILDNGGLLGNGCSKAAVKLRAKMRQGAIRRFRRCDFFDSCGVQSFVLAAAEKTFKKNHEILMMRLDNEIQRYRKQGQDFEWREKMSASLEYQSKTHQTFDPSARPPEGSPNRESWDACKRVYDIFDR